MFIGLLSFMLWEPFDIFPATSTQPLFGASHKSGGVPASSYSTILVNRLAVAELEEPRLEVQPVYQNQLTTFRLYIPSDVPEAIQWNFGEPGGQSRLITSRGQSTEYTYSAPGEYTISAHWTDGRSGEASMIAQCVIVRPAAIEGLTLIPSSSNEATLNQLTFVALTESGTIESFHWALGDTTEQVTASNFLPHSYSVPGAYLVKVEAVGPAYSKNHCGDSEQVRSIETAYAIARIQRPAQTESAQLWLANPRGESNAGTLGSLVVDQRTEFYVTGLSAVSRYEWDMGNGAKLSSTEPRINYAYPLGGDYVVSVIAPDAELPQAAYAVVNVLTRELYMPLLFAAGSAPDGTEQPTSTVAPTPNPTSTQTSTPIAMPTPSPVVEPTGQSGTVLLPPTSVNTPVATMTAQPIPTATPSATATSTPGSAATLIPTSTTRPGGTVLLPPTPTTIPTATSESGTALLPPTPTPGG